MFGNWLKTSILMAGIVALFSVVGAALGGTGGMLLALTLVGAMNAYAYWFSDTAVLKMYNAQEVDERSAPQFYRLIHELAGNAGLPMPRVYIMDEAQPNAFATGRDPEHAAVAATTGIIHILSERELRGVMAHELAHVKHRDTLISTISATIAGAISRSRELEADRGGAEISGDPKVLASALEKIHNHAHNIQLEAAEQHPETAQMMIINPLSGDGIKSLFSTHPQTEERVTRLLQMAPGLA